MTVTIIDCEQGSPEWFKARMGMPTASEFSTVMAAAKDGKERKTRNKYMRKLAGEIITGEPMETFQNAHMERGKAMEDEARDFYSFMKDAEPQRVGFIVCGAQCGCSPDSLIGTAGMLEIKTALPDILIEKILADDFPPEHKAQCQGALMVAEREWIDISVYWPKMPMFVKRAYRDEPYIHNMLAEIRQFNAELHELVEKINRYGT
jgi:hypothetical protein